MEAAQAAVEMGAPTPIVKPSRLEIRMNALSLDDLRSLGADVLQIRHGVPKRLELGRLLQAIGNLYPLNDVLLSQAAQLMQPLLFKLVADALTELPKRGHPLHSRADALIALRKPLPTWCVDDVLLSPDLLPHMFESLVEMMPEGELLGHSPAAAACSMWSGAFRGAWTTFIRRHGYLLPRPQRIKMLPEVRPLCLAEMPDGAMCFHASGTDADDETEDDEDIDIDRHRQRLRFLTAHGEPIPDGGAWANLAQVRFARPRALQLHEEAMLVADTHYDEEHVRRVRLSDGVELARSPLLERIRKMCVNDDSCFVATTTAVCVLDAHTLELRYSFGEFGAAVDCAVWHDEVYVADRHKDAEGELEVFSLDGTHLRTVEGEFSHPNAIIVRNDRIYMLERNPEVEGAEDSDDDLDWDQYANDDMPQRLLVLALDGSFRQIIDLPDAENLCSMCFCDDGRSLVIADSGYDGSEDDGFPEHHSEMSLFRFQA